MKPLKIFVIFILCFLINPRLAQAADITNIALFGVDQEIEAVMIFSYNKTTRKIFITAIPQDTELFVAETDQYLKLQQINDIPLTLSILNHNFDLNIDKYVSFDMTAVEKIVDDIGGAEINLSSRELKEFTNLTVSEEYPDYYLLNGSEAIAYSKLQGLGGGYFGKVMRQQNLTTLIGQKVKAFPKLKLISTVTNTIPYVETNLTANEIISLSTSIAFGNNDRLKKLILPDPNLVEIREGKLIPNTLEKNISQWRSKVYS